jgi:DNA-binding transcriptional LysR family regulator
MDVRLLETLRAVRTHGGVTPAAAVLHLTPSAVSQQLAVLQRSIGMPLTERVGRGLRLTPAGEALAEASVDVAVAVERARAACEAFLERPHGTVRVSAFQSGAQLLLPGLLRAVRQWDGVRLECWDDDVAQEDFVALTDRADVVIAHRPDETVDWARRGEAVRVVPLLREPLDVAVADDHPLAGRTSVRPGDLDAEQWIAVREGFPVAAVLEAVAVSSGTTPRIAHRLNDFHLVAALVAGGHGVALLPRYTFDRHPGLRLLPLVGVRAERRIDALLRPDRAERLVVRRVLDELITLARGVDGGTRPPSPAL